MPQTLKDQLGDIDAHTEAVARNNPSGTDLNELAHAMHNLIGVLDQIITHLNLR
jgi:hypothetical protein